jgi:hypothetical protein
MPQRTYGCGGSRRRGRARPPGRWPSRGPPRYACRCLRTGRPGRTGAGTGPRSGQVQAGPGKVEVDGRVEVAGAGTHHQALQRVSPIDDELDRDDVEPVPADAVSPGHLPVDRVGRGGLGQRGVERGVEHRHLGYPGLHPAGPVDPGRSGRVVRRGERGQLPTFGEYRVIDEYRCDEPRSTVDDPVPDRADLLAASAIQHPLDGAGAIGGSAARFADPLGQPAVERGVSAQQPVFQAPLTCPWVGYAGHSGRTPLSV